MLKSPVRLLAIALLVALAGVIALTPGTLAKKKKKRPVTDTYVYQPPTVELSASPTVLTACEGESARVQLNARPNFSRDGALRYRWSATGGHIDGNGASPTWDLSGLKPGYYRAYVDIDCGTPEECTVFSSVMVLLKCP